MKKLILMTVVLTVLSIGKASAQYLVFWDGDMRLGFSAGASVSLLSKPNIICESDWYQSTTTSVVEGSYRHTPVCPAFKLFYGMEKELSGNFSFGFQGWIGLVKNSWEVGILHNDSKNVTTYTVASNTVDVNEGIYLAYYLTDDFSLSLGAGLSEYIDFGSKGSSVTCDPAGNQLSSADNVIGATAPFDLGFGFMLSLGATYNLSESFYVGANAIYQKSIIGSGTMADGDTFFMNKLGNDAYYSNPPLNSLQLLATIGFRW